MPFAVPTAYYSSTIEEFLDEPQTSILGGLAARSPFAVEPPQRDAWLTQIGLLKTSLAGIDGTLFLEFDVPRVGSRIDSVVISGPGVVVVEFKVGERQFKTADFNQAWDYALDLKNFHSASQIAPILPILVATEADNVAVTLTEAAADLVYRPVTCNPAALGKTLQNWLGKITGQALDAEAWARAPYRPTPTIVEAAQALYGQHSVESIARHDAGAQNLAVTSRRVEEIIELAQATKQKSIVFVTGVPGAGKTLVGLNVATQKREHVPTHAAYLSGNGPLVKVLSEALARDEIRRLRQKGERARKGDIQQKIKAFIQNVHHFRDAGLNDSGPPSDHVVIFDEAQRAWNREMTSDFMKRKKGRPGFTQSEPEFLLSYLDRHPDWAVVICLVGGGQEINRGEAGISAWLDALAQRFSSWSAYISPTLTDSEYDAGHALERLGLAARVVTDDSLHLVVSMRSFRAEHVSRFVKAILDREAHEARELLAKLREFPIVLTRDLNRAKSWIRSRARGSERFGLIASSGAQRLKAHAVDVRIDINPVHWFLNDRSDTRSSFYLEDAATEFQVQGLELDWVCVAWDADLRFVGHDWSSHSFVATKWHAVRKPDRRSYLRNAYRVLLTRARQGMVIYVPEGDRSDPTRAPEFYDGTFDYLRNVGLTRSFSRSRWRCWASSLRLGADERGPTFRHGQDCLVNSSADEWLTNPSLKLEETG